jgi:phage terminase small subunit
MTDLNPKQARFVEEYLVDLNATQAAVRAGYSPKTAEQQGARLLGHARVAAEIRQGQLQRSERTAITQEQVLAELAKIAFSDLADVTDWGTREVAIGFDADGKKLKPEAIGEAVVVDYIQAPYVDPVNRDDLPKSVRSAVAEVALTRDGFKIKMHDKVAALTKLGQHLGMFVERHQHSGPNGGPIAVATIDLTAQLARLTPEERAQVRAMALKLEGGA